MFCVDRFRHGLGHHLLVARLSTTCLHYGQGSRFTRITTLPEKRKKLSEKRYLHNIGDLLLLLTLTIKLKTSFHRYANFLRYKKRDIGSGPQFPRTVAYLHFALVNSNVKSCKTFFQQGNTYFMFMIVSLHAPCHLFASARRGICLPRC